MTERPGPTAPIAVIGLGSSTTRLVIDGPAGVERREVVTRMDQGLTTRGLDDQAVARVVAALTEHRATVDAAGATVARTVGGEVVRRLVDRSPLEDAVVDLLGSELTVLTAGDEGRLAHRGATRGFGADVAPVTVDIGGASTELAAGVAGELVVISVPIGAASVINELVTGDPPSAVELSSALSIINVHLDDVAQQSAALAAALAEQPVVGVGGTFTTAAAVEVGGAVTDDAGRFPVAGFGLDRAAAEDVFRTMVTEAADDRGHNPGLPPDRVDLIVGGMCLVVAIMRRFTIDEIVVTDRGVLDGVVAELRESA